MTRITQTKSFGKIASDIERIWATLNQFSMRSTALNEFTKANSTNQKKIKIAADTVALLGEDL